VDSWPARLEAHLRQDLLGRDVVASNRAQGDSQVHLLASRVAELPVGSREVAIVLTGVKTRRFRSWPGSRHFDPKSE
jgi:hypothetical protein